MLLCLYTSGLGAGGFCYRWFRVVCWLAAILENIERYHLVRPRDEIKRIVRRDQVWEPPRA